MKHTKAIAGLIILLLVVIFFIVEIAPEIKRVNENNKKIVEQNAAVHEKMNKSFKNYESVYNEDTKTRYWNEVP